MRRRKLARRRKIDTSCPGRVGAWRIVWVFPRSHGCTFGPMTKASKPGIVAVSRRAPYFSGGICCLIGVEVARQRPLLKNYGAWHTWLHILWRRRRCLIKSCDWQNSSRFTRAKLRRCGPCWARRASYFPTASPRFIFFRRHHRCLIEIEVVRQRPLLKQYDKNSPRFCRPC